MENWIQSKKWKINEKAHKKFHFTLENERNAEENLSKYKIKAEQMEVLKSELDKRVISLEILYKQERYQREHLEKQIYSITQEFEDLLQGQNKRNIECKGEIAQLCEKIRLLQECLDTANDKLRECEIQRDELKRVSIVSITYETIDKNRKSALSLLQDKLEESEFQRKALKEKLENLIESIQERKKPPQQVLQESCLAYQKDYIDLQKNQSVLQSQIVNLQSECDSKQFEISRLENLLYQTETSKQKLTTIQLSSKENEIKELRISSENARKVHLSLQSTVDLLTEQVKILSEKLACSQQRNYDLSHHDKESINRSKLSSDNADERFSEYIKNYGVEHRFERVAEGVYTFGSKKVSITIKNGYLVCRVGGGYMMIEEFLKLILNQESKNDDKDIGKKVTGCLSPGNHSSRNNARRSMSQTDYELEGAQTERVLEYEYDLSNPINGLKENFEHSPGRYKLSPANKQRAFAPFRRNFYTRLHK